MENIRIYLAVLVLFIASLMLVFSGVEIIKNWFKNLKK